MDRGLVPAAKLAIVRRIDTLYMDYPFASSRMLPDLLRSLVVDRPNQVWVTLAKVPTAKLIPTVSRGMHITYIPMEHGFVWLGACSTGFAHKKPPLD